MQACDWVSRLRPFSWSWLETRQYTTAREALRCALFPAVLPEVPAASFGMLLPRDPQRDVREAVHEIPQLLDLGVRQPVVVTEDFATSGYRQHFTPGRLCVNIC